MKKHTHLRELITAEIDKLNEHIQSLTTEKRVKYTLSDLADGTLIDYSNLVKSLDLKRPLTKETIMRIIIVLRCDPESAEKIIHEAGFDFSGQTRPYCELYRSIIQRIQSPGWPETEEDRSFLEKHNLPIFKCVNRR